MVEQPTGTVTMVFTDIEGSTQLLQRLGAQRYAEALDLHRRLLREAFDRHGGYEVDCEGDAFFVAFATAAEAVAAAAEGQQALAGAEWHGDPIRIRIGVHTGEPITAPPKYVGLDVHKAARVMAAAHGGQVLLTGSTHELLAGDVPVRDLGRHRLKDLLEPEPLYQLTVPGLRDEFPALKTLESRPNNLPLVATPFVGRGSELAAVQELVLRKDVRLVTLTGMGGIGKTRLALQVAAEVSDRFRDGVLWVPFASLRDGALFAATLAQALGLREEPGEAIGDTVCRYLGDKELLLVLDNLEHVLARARDVTAALLRSAPGVHVLATSREALRIGAELLQEIPPLAVPTRSEAPEQSDAVQLFVGRAQAADPTFAVTAANAASIHAIVRRLEGIPLAIELAAARTRVLPPAALLDGLDDRLRLLTSGVHDADERQQTLRATLQWSYDLLDPAEQDFFTRLGVFVGGFRLDAAEAVCDPGRVRGIDLLDVISSLMDKSLLRRRDDPDGQPRYWMLETIREYGVSMLGGEHHDVALRHARHFLACAREAEGSPQRVDPAGSSRLAADLPNLRVALETLSREQRGEFRDLAASLSTVFEVQGLLAEGERWLRLALSASSATDVTTAKLQTGLAKLAIRRGDLTDAGSAADAAIVTARRIHDGCVLADALRARSITARFTGDFVTARALLDEAVGLLEAEGADAMLAKALVDLSDQALNEQRWSDAAALATRAIAAGREANVTAVAVGHLNLGVAILASNRPAEAAESLETGIRLANDLGLTLFVAYALPRLAEALVDVAPSRAAQLLGAAEALQRNLGAVNDPIEIEAAARTSARLRERLTPTAFEAQRADGCNLDYTTAVRLALAAT